MEVQYVNNFKTRRKDLYSKLCEQLYKILFSYEILSGKNCINTCHLCSENNVKELEKYEHSVVLYMSLSN